MLSPSLLFFLYCARALRHLHSFPTRRSSDLSSDRVPDSSGGTRGCSLCQLPLKYMAISPRCAGIGEIRSEEHTSELQSHHDLVCRLLLEKKKKINKSSRF